MDPVGDMTARQITTTAEALYTEGQSVGAALRSASSDDDYRAIAVRAEALRSDAAAVRASLDALDVWGSGITNASDTLDALTWEHATRRTLLDIVAATLRITSAVGDMLTGEPRQRRHLIRTGETWLSIAAEELGDFRRWFEIVEANGLDPAASLVAGTELLIPDAG